MVSEISNYPREERNYGIDLLRIFAMLGIVGLHVLGHGGILQNVQPGVKYISAWGLEVLFSCSVNIYALISGYVGIFKKEYRINKLLYLWFEVFFYGIVIWFVMKTTTTYKITSMSLLHAVMPVASKEYWYFTAYVGLFCLMPLLNFILKNVDRTRTIKIIIGVMLLSCYATVVRVFGDPLSLKDGCTYVWLSICYLLGGLIRRYKDTLLIHRKILWFFICVAYAFTLLWKVIFGMFGITIMGNSVGGLFITSISPPMLLMAICFVCIFANFKTKIFFSKIIRFVTPCTFAVYILHDNPLIREYIISNRLLSLCEKPVLSFLFTIVCVIIIIFLGGVLIDKIRVLFFKILHVNYVLDIVAVKMENFMNKILGKPKGNQNVQR